MSTHKAATRFLHWLLSCAARPMVFQVYPVSFISVSTVLLHVPLGLPGLLFPGGAYFTDLLTILSSFLLSMCPRYLHLLRFIIYIDVSYACPFCYLPVTNPILPSHSKNPSQASSVKASQSALYQYYTKPKKEGNDKQLPLVIVWKIK